MHAARAGAAGAEREADVAAVLAERVRVGQVGGGDEQRDRWVALPERRELLELLREVERERVALGDGVDPDLGHQVLGPQDLGGVLEERRAERLDLVAGDRQARCRLVAAVAGEVVRSGVQAAEQVERRDRAPGAGALVAVEGDQDRRAVVALGDPRGDDPDHAGVPALGRQHERVAGRVLGDQRLGLEADPGLHVASLGVDEVELVRDGPRAVLVLGQQELEARVGAVQPPGRRSAAGRAGSRSRTRRGPLGSTRATSISARRPTLRVEASAFRPWRTSRRFSPVQRHDVGDRGQRDQVEILLGELAGPPPRAASSACASLCATPAAHSSGHG